MTDRIIMEWIAANPDAGRLKIAAKFGINEQRARELKAVVTKKAELSGVEFATPDKLLGELLNEKGLSLDQIRELLNPKTEQIAKIDTANRRSFAVGICGDTHLGDKACAVDQLHDLYRRYDDAGVVGVLHAGDVTAGNDVYRGQYNDLRAFGFSDQLRYAIDNYPILKNGAKTYAISGNHDLSFKVGNGAHFLSALVEKRPDIVDCGDYDGRVDVGGISFALHHGDGGGTYAESYKLQKAIEILASGHKPQVYILGHYHTALYMFRRNIHCLTPGCTQWSNDFSIRKNLPNAVCGWVVHIEVLDDDRHTIRKFSPELISYYQ